MEEAIKGYLERDSPKGFQRSADDTYLRENASK